MGQYTTRINPLRQLYGMGMHAQSSKDANWVKSLARSGHSHVSGVELK